LKKISRSDIQKLFGDENIDLLIDSGIKAGTDIRSIRIVIVDYLLCKFFGDSDREEFKEYPVSGKLRISGKLRENIEIGENRYGRKKRRF